MTGTLLNQIDKLNEYLHLESDINKKDFKYINTMLQSMRNEAINYTRSCETLKDEYIPDFTNWLKDNKYIHYSNNYYISEDNNVWTVNALAEKYVKETNL